MKMKLGKKPVEVLEEEAKRQRELEATLQEEQQIRQQKLKSLKNIQKRNTAIIICVFVLLCGVLIVFGTYNTFFKKGLTQQDIDVTVARNINSLRFPTGGLDNYIRDSSDGLIYKYLSYQPKDFDYVTVDKNSVYISRVKPLNNKLAYVYFSADIETKTPDKVVEDPSVIEILKRNGLDAFKHAEQEQTVQPTVVEPTVEEQPAEEIAEGDVITEEELTEGKQPVDGEQVQTEEQVEQVEEQPVEQPAENTDPTITDSTKLAWDKGSEATEYYVLSNGTYMEKGSTSKERYNFSILIEYYDLIDVGEVQASGYRPASDLALVSLEEIDQTNFNDIEISSYLTWGEDVSEAEEDEVNSARIKVDKTLGDLYLGRDTSQDFLNYKKFNTYGATYNGLNNFKLYNGTNDLGFNAFVDYSITTKQGFVLDIRSYLIIEKSGNSWVIKGIL